MRAHEPWLLNRDERGRNLGDSAQGIPFRGFRSPHDDISSPAVRHYRRSAAVQSSLANRQRFAGGPPATCRDGPIPRAADQTLVQATDLISAARFGQPSETVKLDVFVVSRAGPPTPFCKTATPSSPAPRVDSRDLRERMANAMTRVNGKRSPKRRCSNDRCWGPEPCGG